MRLVVGLIVVAIVVVVVVPVVRYGTVDPCRMLAKDLADDGYRRLANSVGAEPGKTPEAAEALGRMMVSQYSQGECVMKLKDRWLGLDEPDAQ
jgi:hypothetical protein